MANVGYYGQSLQNGGSGPILRDYTHAAKTFLPNGYALTPKFKFLFHVFFDINPDAYSFTGLNYGLLVKTVKLPSFNIDTSTLNQYNRKRIVQTKIKYNPVQVTLHDDNDNNVMHMWEAYYTYYYKDGANFDSVFNGSRGYVPPRSSESDAGYNVNKSPYLSDISQNSNWGYYGESSNPAGNKIPFFKNMTVFGFNRHNFTAYTLINPMITSFNHDTYSYADGAGTMEMQMDLDYESVVYTTGAMDGNTPENIVKGFGEQANYDRTPSPISNKNANSYYPGQGGYAPANGGTLFPKRRNV